MQLRCLLVLLKNIAVCSLFKILFFFLNIKFGREGRVRIEPHAKGVGILALPPSLIY